MQQALTTTSPIAPKTTTPRCAPTIEGDTFMPTAVKKTAINRSRIGASWPES